jgi:hypothetical protein
LHFTSPDGVVGEPAGHAENRLVGLRYNSDDFRSAAQDHVGFRRLAELFTEDYKLAFKSLAERKDAVRDAEETFATDILSFRLNARLFAGSVQTKRIRQPQARTPATIRRIAGHNNWQQHRSPITSGDPQILQNMVGFT